MHTIDMNNNDIDVLVPNGAGELCQCFVVFLRILLKYLENRGEREAYDAIRERVQVCKERARRQEDGYECVAKAVLQEIPQIVKMSDLRRVQAILRLRVEQKKKRQKESERSHRSNEFACGNFEKMFSQGQPSSTTTSPQAPTPAVIP